MNDQRKQIVAAHFWPGVGTALAFAAVGVALALAYRALRGVGVAVPAPGGIPS